MNENESKFVDLAAAINIKPDMESHIGDQPKVDPSKFVELSGHANIDSKELFKMAGDLNAAQSPKAAPGQLTVGDLMQMLLGKLLFGQLMNQPVSEEMLQKLMSSMPAPTKEIGGTKDA